MSSYRFELKSKNPLTGRTEKDRCPACGRKNSLVMYWDNVNQCFVPPGIDGTIYGKCDRENNCQYWEKPTSATHWTHTHTHTRTDQPRQRPKIDITDTFTRAAAKYTSHTLKTFLTSLFDAERVERVLNLYGVTGDRCGNTIFWRRDWDGTTVTGKCISYGEDGHRNKEKPPYWVHSSLTRANMLPPDYTPPICLFGLNVAATLESGQTCHIVESEKTAILAAASGKFDGGCFLATGGSNCTGYIEGALPYLRAKGLNVVLLPDTDQAGQRWREFAKHHGLQVVNGLFEEIDEARRAKGYDLGDLICDALKCDFVPLIDFEFWRTFDYKFGFPY